MGPRRSPCPALLRIWGRVVTQLPMHPDITVPDDEDITIWRYMDFTKFVALLETRTLYFPALAELEDPYEGIMDEPSRREARERHPPSFAAMEALTRAVTCVSCWHMNEDESAAMWKVYCAEDAGIAIRSTPARLYQSIDASCKQGMYIGRVQYGRPWADTTRISVYGVALCKRRSFSYENELRAIWSRPFRPSRGQLADGTPAIKVEPGGAPVPIDPDVLIQSVRVAPKAPPWIANLIRRLPSRYGLAMDIEQSSLYDGPLT